MKILHINTLDIGGAANACLRIHQSLLQKGVDSKVLVLHQSRNLPEVYEYNYWDNSKSRLDRFFKRIKYKRYHKHLVQLYKFIEANPVEAYTEPSTIFDITEHPLYREADLIQLNWTSGFLDEPGFFKKNKKPVIWRMADLYACGGGYHYEKGFLFEVYKKCLEKNFKIRQKAMEGKYINVVAISDWVKKKALESKLLHNYPVTVIHNGIDINVFRQYDKMSARELLGLPQDKKIILIGAASLNNPRKGMTLLLEAINKISGDNIFYCAFGELAICDNKVHSLGFIEDDALLSKIYSAADIFVMSSIEEAFGQVFIESLSCGTPVVSFPNGGGIDIIKNGFNGVLSEDFTSQGLINAINEAVSIEFNREDIRNDTIARFNIADKAGQYIKLYEQILKNNKSHETIRNYNQLQ